MAIAYPVVFTALSFVTSNKRYASRSTTVKTGLSISQNTLQCEYTALEADNTLSQYVIVIAYLEFIFR